MSKQPDLFEGLSAIPSFDGSTYDHTRDHERLASQLQRVQRTLSGGQWLTLAQIATRAKAPQASVSARLRDLRKPKFGSHVIEREYVDGGLHRYRMVS